MEISQDGTSYSGDLLSTIDVLRNMTEIFRRAYYSPTPGDVQVGSHERVPGERYLRKWVDGSPGPQPYTEPRPGHRLGPDPNLILSTKGCPVSASGHIEY